MKYLFSLISIFLISNTVMSQDFYVSEEQKTANSYIIQKYELNIDSVEVLFNESDEFIQLLNENYFMNFYSVVMNNDGQIINFYDCKSTDITEDFSFVQIAELNTNEHSKQYALILFSEIE